MPLIARRSVSKAIPRDRLLRYAFFLAALLPGLAAWGGGEPARAAVSFETDAPFGELNQVRSQLHLTQALIEHQERELAETLLAYRETAIRLAKLQEVLEENRAQLVETAGRLRKAQDVLGRRVDGLYRRGRSTFLMVILGSEDFGDFINRMDFLLSIAEMDRRLVEQIRELEGRLEQMRARLVWKEGEETALLSRLEAEKKALDEELSRAKDLFSTLSARAVRLEERTFTFPVAVPFAYGNDWHAPRDGGTRLHEGTDIFALPGTEVVAAVPGVVNVMSTEDLGGIVLYVRSRAGDRYYYAHLSGYAPEIRDGTRVGGGQVLGYVGNTGNARSTPAHLHFGVYRAAGPVNPYPLLRVAEENGAVISSSRLKP